MKLVKTMVESYIKDERTIIAEKALNKGIRTLGVLTNPDLIDPGTGGKVMSLVRGEKNHLKLGYYALRNRGKLQESSSSEELDTPESEFSAQEPWSPLGQDHVGVHALKKRLQELLVDITRLESPNVRHQINARFDNCRRKLKAMGADRKSTVQQQIYLQAMATNFQKITDHVLDAYYARDLIFAENLEMRLPTLVVDRSDEFAAELAKKRHTVLFDIDDDESEEDNGNSERDGEGEESDFEPIDESIRDSNDGEADGASTLSTDKYPELSSLFPDEGDTPEPQHRHILDWIEHEYKKARARDLEIISPSITY
ncbi:hypothetical protein L207DRAFT_591407 [Hyaloscypha variabilis F]|uniref:Dynamin stalk domain-containing protein n=1 Tax=Hyaloscypha variabilis (strain UAMH 11265 / GT02V1 / F) TaxID=1149755 RepID=A0A2J6QYV3_HYAVF|nr:hypothetical protein L207DRAFT_591407 [Hyaloscypha variabilis F]